MRAATWPPGTDARPHRARDPLVRAAARSGHDPLRRLLRAGYGQYATDIAPRDWEDFLADLLDLDRHARDGQLLVAVVTGQIAGYAAFYPDASSQGWVGLPAGPALARMAWAEAARPAFGGRGVSGRDHRGLHQRFVGGEPFRE